MYVSGEKVYTNPKSGIKIDDVFCFAVSLSWLDIVTFSYGHTFGHYR